MIFIAHQLGHVVQGAGEVPEFYVSTTHTRKGYDHRRRRRAQTFLAVLAWMFS